MSLLNTLRQAVRSWRQRRGVGKKSSSRAVVSMEHLDNRQLLAVNFTGNVINDFPLTGNSTVTQVLPDFSNPATTEANFNNNAALQSLIQVSGFYISGIRLSYSQADDTLSIGLTTPANPKAPGQFVLAGDADNNGNAGVPGTNPLNPPNVDPAVQTAAGGAFRDFANLGGSEYTGVFLDLTGTGQFPQVVAGIGTGGSKLYQVAQTVKVPTDPNIPDTIFGAALPTNTGRLFLNNDPSTPNMEMTIVNFSALYKQFTGKDLTKDSRIGVGAYAGSGDDVATETGLPVQTVRVGDFFVPTPVCPPTVLTPPVLINYHSTNTIDTAHDTKIRVQVFGTAALHVDDIVESTVHLGGATPLFSFDRRIGNYPFETRTFVFRGTDVDLPAGLTPADVTGTLTNGQTFDSTYVVFNRNDAFFSAAKIAARNARLEARGLTIPVDSSLTPTQAAKVESVKVDYGVHAAHAPRTAATILQPSTATPVPSTPAAPKVRATRARLGTRVADLKAQGAGSTAGGS